MNLNLESVHKWRRICKEGFVSDWDIDVEYSAKRKKLKLTLHLSTDMQNAYLRYVIRNQ
jgi:hypothetical protein